MTERQRLSGTPDPGYRWKGADGITLAGDAWGDSDAPLVLLQHGGGQTRHAWRGTGRALAAAGYHAVAFDARGHGDSSWDPELRYDTDSMVRDLVYLVEELGQPSPVLVGASMGGGTSLVAVGEDCLQAAGLVLVDVAPTVEPTGVERIHSFMFGNTDGFASLEDVALAIHEYQPHREGSHDLGGLAKNVRLGQDGRYYWHWDPRIEFSIDQRFREERFAACARRLSLPTLLVRGGLSDVLSEEGARSFLEFCPHAEFVNVEGAAHMVAGDRNDIFAQAVVEFLGRSVPVASPEQT